MIVFIIPQGTEVRYWPAGPNPYSSTPWKRTRIELRLPATSVVDEFGLIFEYEGWYIRVMERGVVKREEDNRTAELLRNEWNYILSLDGCSCTHPTRD